MPVRKAMANSSSNALWIAGAVVASSAIYVQYSSRRAERDNPPMGKFLTVQGTRLHYQDTGGKRPAIVLFHGNGSMATEMEISGVVDELKQVYRVIAFDRPGYGYSARPRNVLWTPAAQADLFYAALRGKGIRKVTVLGHSWGNLVAIELALRHPEFVTGLVLLAGFYFPQVRADVPFLSIPAIPLIGDILRYTLSPLIARAIAPRAVRKMFKPRTVTERFAKQFPQGLTLRPLSLRASAEETAMMIPAAAALQARYQEITAPTFIIAGSADQIVNVDKQSARLHKAIRQSELVVQPNEGHMFHHYKPNLVKQAADQVVRSGRKAA